MIVRFTHHYTYRGEPRPMRVVYDSGAVTVTEYDGDVHSLTYSDGALTGPGSLAQSHRAAIAAFLAAAMQPISPEIEP